MPRRRDGYTNASSVRPSTFLVDPRLLESFTYELEEMNKDKEGASYRCSDSLMECLLNLHTQLQLSYRQLEEFTRLLANHVKNVKPLDHSTIQWRAGKSQMKQEKLLLKPGEPAVIMYDTTGLKIARPGNWIQRWKRTRNEYLKIEILFE
jgi:hypothetical protein